jgi:aminoglycoside N3'-acetyltransferase
MSLIDTVKQRLKGAAKSADIALTRQFRSFTPQDLRALLERLGLRAGDAVLVHSGMEGFKGFEGKPGDVIRAITDAVGGAGHVLMPNQPFQGSAVDHIQSGAVFDVRRTPSMVGFVGEIFRRSDGVVRSLHPTHPVAVRGPESGAFIADTPSCQTPCGAHTAYAMFGEVGGKILLLGTDEHVMTYYHCLEEELEPLLPRSPFTTRVFDMPAIDARGERHVIRNRLLDPVMSRARDMSRIVPALQAAAGWQEETVGSLRAIVVQAPILRATALELAARGVFCYDLARMSTPAGTAADDTASGP